MQMFRYAILQCIVMAQSLKKRINTSLLENAVLILRVETLFQMVESALLWNAQVLQDNMTWKCIIALPECML